MRYFTLQEATVLLPMVRALVERMLAARQQILDLQPELWSTIEASVNNGGSRSGSRAAAEVQRIQEVITELSKLGVMLKDLNTGLVDFPALYRGREVFLCWQYDEPDIAFWHEVDTGFAGRQPLRREEW